MVATFYRVERGVGGDGALSVGVMMLFTFRAPTHTKAAFVGGFLDSQRQQLDMVNAFDRAQRRQQVKAVRPPSGTQPRPSAAP